MHPLPRPPRPSSVYLSVCGPYYCMVHQPTKFRHPPLRLRIDVEPRLSSGSPAGEEVPGITKLPFRIRSVQSFST